ncbi:MAG TPA: hypothetical protein VIK72_19475 [Clostridiaceae bacterium]
MNIILQIYWITVLAGVMSAILRMKLNKGNDPFKAMRHIQEQMDTLPDEWLERFNNLFNWAFDNAPLSLYIVIATLAVIPVVNLMYFWENIKGAIADSKNE